MAKKGSVKPRALDMRTPIKTGVSFEGRVDLTHQGGAKKGKINLGRY